MKYLNIRDSIELGDLIAFGGKGYISNIIKKVTNSKISHVGIAFNSYAAGEKIVQIIESTSLGDGFAGVQVNRLSDYMRDYDGEIWWYPLNDTAKGKMKSGLFMRFILGMRGRKYDTIQAIGSALDFIPDNTENLDKLFCSELVAEAYEKTGIIEPVNSSEMTPQDVLNFNIYKGRIKLVG